MKKMFAFVFIALGLLLMTDTAIAQEHSKKHDTEKTIIIRKKSGPAMVITSDSVSSITINGEKINPEDITSINVMPRMIKGLRSLKMWPGRSGAFLGVATKDNKNGAEIVQVTSNSPAQKAGFEKGDIITSVGDQKIGNPQELAEAIGAHKPGDKVQISYLRGKKNKKINVELSNNNNTFSFEVDSLFLNSLGKANTISPDFRYNFTAPKVIFQNFRNSPSIGLQVQDTEDESGVTVLKVAPGSAAEKAGVKVGDLITAINGDNVKDVNSVLEKMRSAANNEYALKIKRDGKEMSIDVKIPKKLKKAEL